MTPETASVDSSSKLVHTDLSDGVFTITLDSPHNRNALSSALVAQLSSAVDAALVARPRSLVLTHNGPVFCAGADLKERAAATGPADPSPMIATMTALMEAPFVTIAALHGPVRAGGVGLMAACDLVVSSNDNTFAFTEVRIGVAPAIIAVPILRRVPAALLRSAFLTGSVFGADVAARWGLITHPVPAAEVESTAAALCSAVAAGSPTAVAATKRLLGRVPELEVGAAFTEMAELSNTMFEGSDAQQGMAAFARKEQPQWGTTSPDPAEVPGLAP